MKRLLILLCLTLLLCSCSNGEKKASYTIDEIYSDNAYGFFVKDDDTFYPVTYVESDDEVNFKWTKGKLKCPKVTGSTPLVAVYDNTEDMPEEYFLDSYKSIGFSIGSRVKVGEDRNSLWLDTSYTCPGSDMEEMISNEGLDMEVEIDSINNTLPISNIDTDINILTGLQANKYYDISVFIGTQNKKGSFCADTMVLKRIGHANLEYPLNKTSNQYFVVNLPENIKPGYYDINGEGLFEI